MRRRIGEDLLPECIQQIWRGGGGSVVVCGCNSCDGIGPITKVKGRMNGKDYIRFYLDTCFPTCNQWDLGKF